MLRRTLPFFAALLLAITAHAASYIAPPQGRLTLQSGLPVMTADQAGVGTIYYDAYNGGNIVPYYTGSADALDQITSNEMTLTLEAAGAGVENNNDNFDIWWFHNAGTPVIVVATNGSGGGWSADTGGSLTARGTGYSQIDNSTRQYITNKNIITHAYNGTTDYGPIAANQATYLGGFYTTAAGKTTQQFAPTPVVGGTNNCVCLYNPFNLRTLTSFEVDATNTWNYGTATWRAADGNANNKVRYFDGLGQMLVVASAATQAAGPNQDCSVSVDFDSASAAPTGFIGDNFNGNGTIAGGTTFMGIGLHYAQWIEKASGTCGFNGSNAGATKGALMAKLHGD